MPLTARVICCSINGRAFSSVAFAPATSSSVSNRHSQTNFSRLISTESTAVGSTQALPNKTDVVVCGGGLIGSSVAYAIAKDGRQRVLLIERGKCVSLMRRLFALEY